MGQTREQRIIKQLSGGAVQHQTAIASDMFLPNHSGIASHPEAKKNFVPYVGATSDVDLGANSIKSRTVEAEALVSSVTVSVYYRSETAYANGGATGRFYLDPYDEADIYDTGATTRYYLIVTSGALSGQRFEVTSITKGVFPFNAYFSTSGDSTGLVSGDTFDVYIEEEMIDGLSTFNPYYCVIDGELDVPGKSKLLGDSYIYNTIIRTAEIQNLTVTGALPISVTPTVASSNAISGGHTMVGSTAFTKLVGVSGYIYRPLASPTPTYTCTDAACFEANWIPSTTSGSVTNSYLFKGYFTGSSNLDTTNFYGLYLPGILSGATNKYGIVLLSDDAGWGATWFGAGKDAKIYYDGTNMIINPRVVGSGYLDVQGNLRLSARDLFTDTTTGMKIGTATNQKIGFWNATPVVQQVTNAYSTDDESSAYSGIDNLQVGSVYAQVSDLNQLRTAYENLRASYDDLLTKLKNTGVVA